MPNQTKFELSMFENLLQTDFHPLNIENTLKTKPRSALTEELTREGIRIAQELRNTVLRNCEEAHLERYIQMHQQQAIKLLDVLYAYSTNESAIVLSENALSIYLTISQALENLLGGIEKDLSRYFSLNISVPASYRISSAEALRQDSLVLTAKLRSKETEASLQKIILDFIQQHCAKSTCTYRELIYVKLLIKSLLRMLGVNKLVDWNKKIIVELIYLNFNKSTFFTYCRRSIANAVEDAHSVALQEDKFNWFIKEIRKLHIKPNIGCSEHRPPLAELLIHYITLELEHLAELQKTENALQPVQNLKERAEHFSFKLPLSLSVKQLAYIVQLFIDVGVFVIAEGQIMTVMKFFADHVSTKGAADISADSLYNHRKNPLAKVRDEVELLLINMLGLLKN